MVMMLFNICLACPKKDENVKKINVFITGLLIKKKRGIAPLF